MSNFRPVSPLRFLVNLAIPTLQSDSLSYLEELGKANYKLNEVIEQLNNVPEMVNEKIEAAFDTSGLEEKIKEILSDTVISVKNPPGDIPPAKGDGVTNDTAAIQQVINYAANLPGIHFVELPAGTYIVNKLELKENVSIVGENVYSTIIKLANYANQTVISGELNNAMLSNFTVDLNAENNSANNTGINISGSVTSMLDTLRIVNGKSTDTAILFNNNGVTQIEKLYIEKSGATLRGDGEYIITNLFVDSLPFLQFGFSNSAVAALNFKNTPLSITGSNNSIVGNQIGSSINSNNLINSINIHNKLSNVYADVVTQDSKNWTVDTQNAAIVVAAAATLSADSLSFTATTFIENVAGNKTVNAGNVEINVDHALDVTAAAATETVTNKKEEDFGDLSTRVTGDKVTTVGGNVTETITGDSNVSAKNYSLASASAAVFTGKSVDITSTDATKLKAKDIILDSQNPITYRKAEKLTDNYNYIPFTSPTGETIQVLVFNGTDPTPTPPDPQDPVRTAYINVKDFGAAGDGTTDDTEAIKNASNASNGFLYFPYGTYRTTAVISLPAGILGIISEGATVTSQIIGSLFNVGAAAFSVVNITLSSSSAENLINATGKVLYASGCIFNGNITGDTLIFSGVRVNNSSTIHGLKAASITGSVLNANLKMEAGGSYSYAGNIISGSFVINTTTEKSIQGVAITGNNFTAPTVIGDTYIQNLRIAGNVNMEDYPKIVIPAPTPAWDYIVPDGTEIKFPNSINQAAMGMDANNNWYLHRNGYVYLKIAPTGEAIDMPQQVNMGDSLNISGQTVIDDVLTVYDTIVGHNGLTVEGNILFNGSVKIPENHGIYFGTEGTPKYLLYKDPSDTNLHLWGYDAAGNRNEWLRVEQNQVLIFPLGFLVGPYLYTLLSNYNGVSLNGALYVPFLNRSDMQTGGLGFNNSGDSASYQYKIGEDSSTGQLIFVQGKKSTGFMESAFVDGNGQWNFKKNIIAPNVGGGSGSIRFLSTGTLDIVYGEANAKTIQVPVGESDKLNMLFFVYIVGPMGTSYKAKYTESNFYGTTVVQPLTAGSNFFPIMGRGIPTGENLCEIYATSQGQQSVVRYYVFGININYG